jgi:Rod binding domain-containing protein
VSDIPALSSISGAVTGPLTTQADRVIRQAGSPAEGNAKIEKSAKDFESLLLGSWLQEAEQSFAALPGGDDDEDSGAGKDQFQGIAMQALGTSMTAAGGIGIAKMISKQLHKAEDARVTVAEKTHPD